jgi:SAM-dependent methyltransferase
MRSPDSLLMDHVDLFNGMNGPVLDLACGDGHNGVFLASRGCRVVLADVSEKALAEARTLAEEQGAKVSLWQIDLEKGEENPLQNDDYGAILVFRYLHRPLMPGIKKALKKNGIIIYETFTVDQAQFGKPKNPDFLLRHGELLKWFEGWEVIYQFEGILQNPERAIAQIICIKP